MLSVPDVSLAQPSTAEIEAELKLTLGVMNKHQLSLVALGAPSTRHLPPDRRHSRLPWRLCLSPESEIGGIVQRVWIVVLGGWLAYAANHLRKMTASAAIQQAT